ncbi:MAG: hypothetical protein KAT77_03765 [Nanoarchaeota archaeon]|nr:hypothetical protein [Nanoarchaeota archaeon]
MAFKLILIFILLFLVACSQEITNFEECEAAGNLVKESYPRQCRANGQIFVEEINETDEQFNQPKSPKIPSPQPPPPSSTPVPVPTPQTGCNNIEVAAIKLIYTDYSPGNLIGKINSVLQDYPSVDLIVTPEYTLYGWGPNQAQNYKRDPVIINCDRGQCTLTSIGTAKSDAIVDTVDVLKSTARQNQVNIVLGTVASRRTILERDITLNTQLIIDRQGNVIAEHLAAKKYDFFADPYISCQNHPPICQEIYDQSLNTVQAFTLSNRDNINFKIALVICGEMIDTGYADKLANEGVDIVVNSNFDQDCSWDNETKAIFAGHPVPQGSTGCWPEIIQQVINIYDNKRLIKDNSYLLVSDGLTGAAGIIPFRRTPQEDLELGSDYVYGVIKVGDSCSG